MLGLNKLPRYHHPLFYSDNFKKVTDDGFFVSIDASDSLFDKKKTVTLLKSIGSKNIEVIAGDE